MSPSFPTLERALAHYDTNMAFSNAAADSFVQRMLSEPGVRERAKAELSQAQRDPNTPWADLLTNDRYEVDDPLPSEEAKEVVLDLLWDAINPEQAPRVNVGPYRIYRSSTDDQKPDLLLEEISSGRELARISRLSRDGDKLVVEYAQLASRPLPATLRKYLREGLCQMLGGQPILVGARILECVDTERNGSILLPL